MSLDPRKGEQEDHTTRASDQITADDSGNRDSGLSLIAAMFQPPQPTAPQQPATQQPEKWYKDRKFVLECLGFLVLSTYTLFSCLQWLQIRWTNKLTREALDGSNGALTQTLAKMQAQIDETSKLADATGRQADASRQIAANAATQAKATSDLAIAADEQADRTKDLADRMKEQAGYAKLSAEAAKSAADTAIAGIRPWIKIESVEMRSGGTGPIKTLMFHFLSLPKEYPPTLQMKTKVINIGQSVAQEMAPYVEVFLTGDSTNAYGIFANEEERFCKSVAGQRAGAAAVTTFPKEHFDWDMGAAGVIGGEYLTPTPQGPRRTASAAIIECINYRGAPGTNYQTQAIFLFWEKSPPYPSPTVFIGVDVDMADLEMRRDPNGDHAN